MSLQIPILIKEDRPYCTCKRSNCLKKYCVCFSAGLDCDPERCQCINCKDPNLTNSRVASRPFISVCYYTPVKKHKRTKAKEIEALTPEVKRRSIRDQWMLSCGVDFKEGKQEEKEEGRVELEEKREIEERIEPIKDLGREAVFSYIDNFFTDSTIDEFQPCL